MKRAPSTNRVGQFEVHTSILLGEGGFGKVFHAKDVSGSIPCEVAAKYIKFSPGSERDTVEREVRMLRTVGRHESIIELLDYVEEPDGAWIFLERATGGELFERLIENGRLMESTVLPYAFGIVSGLHHCHERGIVHRDVKLENVMLSMEHPYAVKLVDFGLAILVPVQADGQFQEVRHYEMVGSRSYKAPEMFASDAGYFAPPVDSWALGIVLFSLLSGFFPFDQANDKDWRFKKFAQDVASGKGPCDALFAAYKRECTFSANCKEFVDSLLEVNASRRLSFGGAINHAWLTKFHLDEPQELTEDEELVYRSCCIGPEESNFDLPEGSLVPKRQKAMIGAAIDDEPMDACGR
mmetsp:Transcript_30321/g.50185  ORF Transcript_30321/g.50185 Transcript_30321/m.50185 type:complete len:353 (-) Transcript_30321:611-1669(-)